MPAATQYLKGLGFGLSFDAHQAWTFSHDYIASYLNEHSAEPEEVIEDANEASGNAASDDSNFKVAALMAAGRLNWLLQKTRPSLSGLLSERDIVTLLDCFQSSMFFPDQFGSIASDLCDHLGVDPYEPSCIAPLVAKLLGLHPIQRVTLADALEQTWHRGMKQENMSPKEFLATLGIDLT